MTTDPKILGLALLLGVAPALFWLWFWLREDKEKPEPTGLIVILFIVGMISVIFVIPAQKFVQNNITSSEWQIISWASIEEIMKYLGVVILIYKTKRADEPIDWPIFLITVALGFAALENTMFLIKPLSLGQTTVGLLTGQLRFLGSTLLHAVSSGIIGVALGLSFFMGKFIKKIYLFAGLILAIALHSVFNFFIMEDKGSNFLRVMGFLWVVTIIIMLIFEKLRRMSIKN
ncbi:MAG: PrsW family glutamic-type intramembrane protease [Candidatus Nomurabacteria bacterium]|nr:PrsW family glutamic-type intramembrane protease [Candidatus Nomurabacteria bacterium]